MAASCHRACAALHGNNACRTEHGFASRRKSFPTSASIPISQTAPSLAEQSRCEKFISEPVAKKRNIFSALAEVLKFFSCINFFLITFSARRNLADKCNVGDGDLYRLQVRMQWTILACLTLISWQAVQVGAHTSAFKLLRVSRSDVRQRFARLSAY